MFTQPNTLIQIVVAIVVIAGAFGAAYPFFRKASTASNLQLLRNELADEKQARLDQDRRWRVKFEQHEKTSNEKIARLEGQVSVLTDNFADTIAAIAVPAMVKEMTKEMKEFFNDSK